MEKVDMARENTMPRDHHYLALLNWTGGQTNGPARDYKGYSRAYSVAIEGKPTLKGSADAAFMGDASLHNPEDLLLASVASCHMLWYLHLCTAKGIVVLNYQDKARGLMVEEKTGAGYFKSICLSPRVEIEPGGDINKATALHQQANNMCFIANSLNFPVTHKAEIISRQIIKSTEGHPEKKPSAQMAKPAPEE